MFRENEEIVNLHSNTCRSSHKGLHTDLNRDFDATVKVILLARYNLAAPLNFQSALIPFKREDIDV